MKPYSYDRRATATLTWRDWEELPERGLLPIFYSEAKTPDGRYLVKGRGDTERDVAMWMVEWTPAARNQRSVFITPTGREQRRLGRRVEHRSKTAAKGAAEKHRLIPQAELSPETIARGLPAGQRDYLVMVRDNKLPVSHGTGSEVAIRSWVTRMSNALKKQGLLKDWDKLTELGKAVTMLL